MGGQDLNDDLTDLDFWRLCDELSVYEAAVLVIGESPGTVPYLERRNQEDRPRGYEAARNAIKNALRAGRIRGRVQSEFVSDFNGNETEIPDSVSVHSRVEVESLREWLASRCFRGGFFFPDQQEKADYLDPEYPRYAPKLAAAVRA
jgi:hypothetical protein